jgi:two-component system CheB/CheR fusion protein
LTIQERDGQAVILVRDNGVGIAPDMQARIFDLFVQAPQIPADVEAGMGIGLTLVQSIVSLHEGQVTVRSQGPGSGSEFEVRLPITLNQPAEAVADELPPETNVSVVIVEDNADSREMLESLLKMDGYKVATAEDGQQGYQTIVLQNPDVALVDLGLPGIDGYEIARRVRSELSDRPIRLIALTGYGRSVDRDAVFAAGFDEHLVKPVDPDDIVRILRKPR